MRIDNTTTTAETTETTEANQATGAAAASETTAAESAPAEPTVTDTAEQAGDEPAQELGGKDAGANEAATDSHPSLSDLCKQKLDDQVAKYRAEAQRGVATIAEPNDARADSSESVAKPEDVQDADSVQTMNADDAADIEAAGKDLDAATARGRKLVTLAGRKALGKESHDLYWAEKLDAVGLAVEGSEWVATGAIGIAKNGKELADLFPRVGAFAQGVALVNAAVTSYTSLGCAHQEAHEFNHKEGYAQGYAKGYAAALYGEDPRDVRRWVNPADNSKRQTYMFAFNDGARRGYADAMRLSEADKAAARMYLETEMAETGEDYLWGNSDVAGAYVKLAGE